jgi:phosphoribosylanthranilate isomerase
MARIKICGITNAEDALAAARFGAHALGFIFVKGTPRYIEPERAAEIAKQLPPFITRVGVFDHRPADEIERIADLCRLDALQLHVDNMSESHFRLAKRRIIKVCRVKDEGSLYDSLSSKGLKAPQIDAYLLDTYSENRLGGTGTTFDWSLALKAKAIVGPTFPIILSGGLNPDNVAEAIKSVEPYAVDVGSGVEERPGKKDHNKLRRFIETVLESNRV